MSWIYDGLFTAHRMNPTTNKPEVKKFTSSAQARQFVEQETGQILAKPVRKHQPKSRKGWTAQKISQLNPDDRQQGMIHSAKKLMAGIEKFVKK